MRTTIRILYVTAGITLSTNAPSMEPEEVSCSSKFDTAEALNQCLSEAVTLIERDLETMRQALLKALSIAPVKSPGGAAPSMRPPDELLEKAQKAWREYRDTNCNYYEQSYSQVSTPSTERVVCQLRMTRQRMLELNNERQFWVYKFRNADMQAQEPAK